MRHRWSIWIPFVAILATGCVGGGASRVAVAPSGSSPVPPASASASPTHTSVPTVEPLPSDLDPEIAHAIDMRRGSGLRYDLAYVEASMTDPGATRNLLDFPLYPEEEAKLLADQADQDVAAVVIHEYSLAHQDEFGGVYVDRDAHPGTVTALWTGHLAEHERAIGEQLGGRLVLHRQVRYSRAYLQQLVDKAFRDLDWMAEIPAKAWGYGVDIPGNVIDLEVSSAEPTAVQQIVDHYALGDRLRVTSDGTGAMLLPWGTVKGRVLGPDGTPFTGERTEQLDLQWTSAVPGDCGGGDIGYGVQSDGRFEVPCQVGERTIIVQGPGSGDEWHELGRGTVTVRANKTVKLTVRLTTEP